MEQRFYCKGDNSFRLEGIGYSQVIGVIILNNDKNNNLDFIESSLRINKLFRKCGYDENALRSTREYKEYKEKYLS